MSDDGQHVQVPTYVPASQREMWREEADELDMSQAEYVRTMIQAGRRSFDLDRAGRSDADRENSEEPRSPDATPRGEALKTRVLDILREEEFADWDELLAGVTDDVEDRLDEAVKELQSDGRIQYSGRDGGYTVVADGR